MSEDTENEKSDESSGSAAKPQSTGDLKRFLNSDPDDLPDAQARTPEIGPGGADATENESDVGRGEDSENRVADQPLSAQQSEAEVPDDIQEPEDVDAEGTEGTEGDEGDEGDEPA